MTDQLQHNQEIQYTIANVKDAAGNEASFEDPPEWVSSDPGVVDLRVAADGLSALAGSFAADGSVVITVTGDARWGPDVVPIVGTVALIVTPADVATFDVVAGGPAGPRT
jgi:hypothetical protein